MISSFSLYLFMQHIQGNFQNKGNYFASFTIAPFRVNKTLILKSIQMLNFELQLKINCRTMLGNEVGISKCFEILF